MSTVFISYSQKDKEVAAKVKATLEANDIKVTIDSESMDPGEGIRAFIDRAVRDTQVTLSIVSRNSLSSDWVALESVESFAAVKFLEGKKFIACKIDDELLRVELANEILKVIDLQIKQLEKEIRKGAKNSASLLDLEDIKNRKYELRNNVSKILKQLRGDLTLDISDAEYETSMQRIIKRIQALPPADSSQAGDKTPPEKSDRSNSTDKESSNGREVERQYLNWLKKERITSELKYTELSGRTQRVAELQNLFRHQPIKETGIGDRFALEVRKHQLEPFSDAVTEILSLRQAVLLGDPGSGKTTTLWKLAERLCAEAEQDPNAPIPVLVRLGFWTGAEQTLTEFIAKHSGPLGSSIDRLLEEKRITLLLDGMNEIPTGQWKAKHTEIDEFFEANSDLIRVVSCRELDYTTDLKLHRIVILPLDPLRIRLFIDEYLPAEDGERLFWKLAGRDAEKLYQEFTSRVGSSLEAPDETFWLARHLPDAVSWWEWHKWIEFRDRPDSLMRLSFNPFMLRMICEIYEKTKSLPDNKGQLFKSFVEVLIKREIDTDRAQLEEIPLLQEALAQLAYEMQMSPSPIKADHFTEEDPEEDEIDEDDEDEEDDDNSTEDSATADDRTMTSMPASQVRVLIGERMLELAKSANLLSGEEEIRFAHQLLQEYFTAIYMEKEIRNGRLTASKIWPAESWWQRTGWEVATRLLAGLHTDDCSWVVNWVSEVNPEVAAECIVLSGAALALETKKRVRREWRARLNDLARDPDPRARAALGRALGLTGWDNREGVGTVMVEVEGQTIRLPDVAWVDIPAGEFIYGIVKPDTPPQKVYLPAFRISRYPVTYAQFQTFIDNPEGYQNQNRWFEGLTDDEDYRKLEDQYFRLEGRAYANDPRESVNWYQAVAFCRWLSWRLGGEYALDRIDHWKVRLPTEQEWERAARGTDGRIYPYGDEYDPAKGNTDDTGIGRTCAVGIFPHGSSPDGVMDMSGNVWDWCLTTVENNQTNPTVLKVTNWKSQPWRGGAWLSMPHGAHSIFRSSNAAYNGFYVGGFRVVSVVRPPT